MSESRKDVLLQALETEVGVAAADPGSLFTDDVVGWSQYASVSGLTALVELIALREIAFSNVVLVLRVLDEVGNKAFAEWLIEADHTGCRFNLNGNEKMRFFVPMLGRHTACNALAAIAVGRRLGLTEKEIAEGLATCKGPDMRLQLQPTG